jgi:hypothetical protein
MGGVPDPDTASDDAPTPAGGDGPVPASGRGQEPRVPDYKGEPLDAERGPGLGCFWIQIALLIFFLVFTPLTVTWGWDPLISGVLLILTLVLLLISGQTIIFLLRLVAADRRSRRAPLSPAAKPTVGQIEDASAGTPEQPADEPASTQPVTPAKHSDDD